MSTGTDVDTYASNPLDLSGGTDVVIIERPQTVDPLLSAPIVAALERAWTAIGRRHPDLPAVVMVLASGSDGAPAGWLKLGHFAAMRWQTRDDVMPEVFIGGEGLARGATNVLATLLHEAAHALAHVRDIKDTSRQGRYHNARYADLARSLGLEVAQIHPIGWSNTTITDALRTEYAATIADLTTALTIFRRSENPLHTNGSDGDDQGEDGGDATRAPRRPASPARPGSNGVVAVCDCGRRLRITRTVLEAGPITCGLCQSPFQTP